MHRNEGNIRLSRCTRGCDDFAHLEANHTEVQKQIHLVNKKKDCKAWFFIHQIVNNGTLRRYYQFKLQRRPGIYR